MKRYLYALVVLVLSAVMYPEPALAHVLIRDSRANIGAVLHINPDDDPIAGQTSQLYFDLQDKNSQVRLPYDGYELTVTDDKNKPTKVSLSSAGSSLIAGYDFPVQGLYTLRLRSKPAYDQFLKVSLDYSLRVSRGASDGSQTAPQHPLADTISVVTGVSFVVLAMLGFNYRRSIARHSTW